MWKHPFHPEEQIEVHYWHCGLPASMCSVLHVLMCSIEAVGAQCSLIQDLCVHFDCKGSSQRISRTLLVTLTLFATLNYFEYLQN